MNDQTQRKLNILRIYTKDLSFESPKSPESFTKQFQPEIRLNVSTSSQKVDSAVYEVVLELTAEAKEGEETIFIAEVEQAGLFQIEGFDEAQRKHCLGVFCPDTLFPYARHAIDQMLNLGSLPPLMLAPINFEQIRRQNTQGAKSDAQ